MVRQLGNARLLTVRGDGHGVVTELNACALVAVIRYVNDTTLPPEGATCEQDIPFAATTRAAALSRCARPTDLLDPGTRQRVPADTQTTTEEKTCSSA